MNAKTRMAVGIATVGIALSGCAGGGALSPIRMTIEELGAEGVTRSDGNVKFRSAVNITGISQPVSAGGYLSVPNPDNPELLSVPLTAGCSRIVETLFESDDDAATAVLSIGAGVDSLRNALVEKVAAGLKAQALRNLKARIDQVKAAGKPPGDDEQVKKLATLLSLDSVPDDAALNGLIANAKTAEDNAAKLAAGEQLKIAQLSNRNNLVISRWQSEVDQSFSTSLGVFFGLSRSRSEARSGYLVMADFRTASLELGADAVMGLQRAKGRKGGPLEIFPGNSYIVHFTMAARHHYFVEDRDLSKALQAALKLSAAELEQIFGGEVSTFLRAQSLAVEFALASSVAASSRGMMTSPKREQFPFRLGQTFVSARSADAERLRNQGYSIIHSTRSNLPEIGAVPPTDWMAGQCDHSYPSGGTMRSLHLADVGFEFCLPDSRKSATDDPFDAQPNDKRCINLAKPIAPIGRSNLEISPSKSGPARMPQKPPK